MQRAHYQRMNPNNWCDGNRNPASKHCHQSHSSYHNHPGHQNHQAHNQSHYNNEHLYSESRHVGGFNTHLHKRGPASNPTTGRNSQLPEIQVEYEVTVPLISPAYHHRTNPYSSSLWDLHSR